MALLRTLAGIAADGTGTELMIRLCQWETEGICIGQGERIFYGIMAIREINDATTMRVNTEVTLGGEDTDVTWSCDFPIPKTGTALLFCAAVKGM
jgi:hypothetical protein